MNYKNVVLRKESFGGIIGRRSSYGYHVVNETGYELLNNSLLGKLEGLSSGEKLFLKELNNKGYLDDSYRYKGELIDNKNVVSFMSAPIRVWIEVTSNCNLSCGECFNHQHKKFQTDLSLSEIKNILNDLARSGVLQITITGGEPLIRKDIWEILDYAFSLGFDVRFFSNGTTLNETNASRLSKYPISHIFTSLDGIGETNDLLRGSGTFSKISKGVVRLAKNNDHVTLSVTLHSGSLDNIPMIFDFAAENNIRSLLIRPLLQYSDTPESLQIPQDQIASFFNKLEKESKRTKVEYQVNKFPFYENKKEVYVYDNKSDVHFSYFTKHNKFGCVGGNTVVGIKSDGSIMACGFVKHSYDFENSKMTNNSFLDLWNDSDNVKVLRDRGGNEVCNKCPLLDVCGGGCRANALLYNDSLDAIDPYCFWGKPEFMPKDISSNGRDKKLLNDVIPYISERTITTKCGSGSLY